MPEDNHAQDKHQDKPQKDPAAEQEAPERTSTDEGVIEDLELDEEDAEVTERVRGGRRTRAISIPY